jgi:hypothetical protein
MTRATSSTKIGHCSSARFAGSESERIGIRQTFQRPGLGWRDRAGFVEPDIFIELLRQNRLEIMAGELRFRAVDHADRAFSAGALTPTSRAMRSVCSAPQQSRFATLARAALQLRHPVRLRSGGFAWLPPRVCRSHQPFRRPSAVRLRSTTRRELGSSIAAAFSRLVRVRETARS